MRLRCVAVALLYDLLIFTDGVLGTSLERTRQIVDWHQAYQKISIGKANCLKSGTKVAVLSNGTLGNNVRLALDRMKDSNAIAHYDFPFVKPLDEVVLHQIFHKFTAVVTVEDGVVTGGFGTAIVEFGMKYNYQTKISMLGIPDEFIEQGTLEELQQYCKIDVDSLFQFLSSY